MNLERSVCDTLKLEKQLRITEDDQVELRLRKPTKAGQKVVTFEAVRFLRRLSWLIPPSMQNLVRHHGILGPAAKRRQEVIPKPEPTLSVLTDNEPPSYRPTMGESFEESLFHRGRAVSKNLDVVSKMRGDVLSSTSRNHRVHRWPLVVRGCVVFVAQKIAPRWELRARPFAQYSKKLQKSDTRRKAFDPHHLVCVRQACRGESALCLS